MRESKIKWKSELPKKDGEYLVTIQTEPYTNKVFAENINTGEYVGLLGNYEEVEYYYDVVK